jgi:hypothetical protein
MAKNNSKQSIQMPALEPTLKSFEKFVGTWELSGDATGQIRYEWAEGKHFLFQHVDIHYGGRNIKGIEVIGYLRRVNAPPSKEIW